MFKSVEGISKGSKKHVQHVKPALIKKTLRATPRAEVEKALERVLLNCFAAQPKQVRPLAKQLAAQDKMGPDLIPADLLHELAQMIKQYWPHVHSGVLAIEVAHVFWMAIEYIRRKVVGGDANLNAVVARENFLEECLEFARQEEDALNERYRRRDITADEFKSRQRKLRLSREVFERAIR